MAKSKIINPTKNKHQKTPRELFKHFPNQKTSKILPLSLKLLIPLVSHFRKTGQNLSKTGQSVLPKQRKCKKFIDSSKNQIHPQKPS